MTFEQGIIVETDGGIGFEILLPAGSPLYRYGEGEIVKVFTYMAVKEDDVRLYGFHNRESLELFQQLITVSGIGAKGALAILSAMTPDEFRRAILFEDAKEICKANGIGKKTAERLILELKDKIGRLPGLEAELPLTGAAESVPAEGAENHRGEAVAALMALGYSKAEAFTAISQVTEDDLSSEAYIKKALRYLF